MTDKNKEQEDRNLINSSETVESGFEENLKKIWDQHHMKILGGIVVLFLLVTGFHVKQIIQEGIDKDIQTAYLEALGDERKELEFAETHSDHSLAGIVYFNRGNQLIADDKVQAASYFGKASKAFQGTVMESRSLIAMATAQIESGDVANGKKTLQAIVDNSNAFKTFKGEAYLKLLILAIEENDPSAIDRIFENLNAIEGIDQILARALAIKNQFYKENS